MAEQKRKKPDPVFVRHPVTEPQKRALLREYPANRIVDARFAPEGAEILTADGEPEGSEKPKADGGSKKKASKKKAAKK